MSEHSYYNDLDLKLDSIIKLHENVEFTFQTHLKTLNTCYTYKIQSMNPYIKDRKEINKIKSILSEFYNQHPQLLDDFTTNDLSQHCDFYEIERYPLFHIILKLKQLKNTTDYVIK